MLTHSPFTVEVLDLVTTDSSGKALLRRNQYWERIGLIDSYLSLNIVLNYNDVSTWRLRLVPGTDQAKLLYPGRKILIWYEGRAEPLLSGPLTSIERYWDDSNRGPGSIDFIGESEETVLKYRLITPWPEALADNAIYAGRFTKEYDTGSNYSFSRFFLLQCSQTFGPLTDRYNTATTTVRSAVNPATGATQSFEVADKTVEGYRTLPGYDLPTSAAQNPAMYADSPPSALDYPRIAYNERMNVLLTELQDKAASATDVNGATEPVAFRLIWDPSTKQITPKYWLPKQVSTEDDPLVLFSADMGNLLRFQYTLKAAEVDRTFIGMNGDGVNRRFWYGGPTGTTDTTALDEWGLQREDYRDRSDLTSPYDLSTADKEQAQADVNQAIAEFTTDASPLASFTCDIQDTEECVFGRDYFLGDMVQADVDGELIQDVIRQVQIVEDEGRFTITTTFGTGDASETPTIYKKMKVVWEKVKNLPTHTN